VKTRAVKRMTRHEATVSFERSSLFAKRRGVNARSMAAMLRSLVARDGFKDRVVWDGKTAVFKPASVVLPEPESVAAPLPLRYVSSLPRDRAARPRSPPCTARNSPAAY